MTTILLTGFEPFSGSTLNPSAELIHAVAAAPPAGWQVATTVLPVDYRRAPDVLLSAIDQHRPDAILCLGEAGRAEISVERVAVNLLDFEAPDNGGARVVDELIAPHGPAAYFATLPVSDMVACLQAAGVPARASLSAGSFICNQVMYVLLGYLAEQDLDGYAPPAGFVHVPRLPAQVASGERPGPSMSLALQIRALHVMLDTLRDFIL